MPPRPNGCRVALLTASSVAPPEPEVEAAIKAFGEALELEHTVETPDLDSLFAE